MGEVHRDSGHRYEPLRELLASRLLRKLITGYFTLDDPRPAFTGALIFLIVTVFLVSPLMRFFRSDILILILISGIFCHVLLGLSALARQGPPEGFSPQIIVKEQPARNSVREPSLARIADEEEEEHIDDKEYAPLEWSLGVIADLKKASPTVPAYSKLSVMHLSVLMRLDAKERVAEAEHEPLRRSLVELGLVSNHGKLRPNGVRVARHLRRLGYADLLRLWTIDRKQAVKQITNS